MQKVADMALATRGKNHFYSFVYATWLMVILIQLATSVRAYRIRPMHLCLRDRRLQWRRLVKNIGGNPKYWGKRVVITHEIIGVSQLLGEHGPGLPPKTTPMAVRFPMRDYLR